MKAEVIGTPPEKITEFVAILRMITLADNRNIANLGIKHFFKQKNERYFKLTVTDKKSIVTVKENETERIIIIF